MAVHYRLYQNNNIENKGYKKWYARAVALDTVTTDQIADTIEANCTVKRADILAVLSELVVTMKKELQNSKRVKLDRFGTFKLGINTSASESAEEFSAGQNVKNVHVLFMPEVTIGADGRRVKALVEGCKVTELPKNFIGADKAQSGTTVTD